MTPDQLYDLWLNAPSSPWKPLKGCLDDSAYGIGNDQTAYSSIDMAKAVPYILALNHLAPKLIELWEAGNRWAESHNEDEATERYSAFVTALHKLNQK